MTRAKNSARSPLRVPVIIIAVIVAVLFVSAAYKIADSAAVSSYGYSPSSYIYAAEGGRFGTLYDTATMDMEKHAEYSAEVAECRALAFYYEQAVLEHAYRKCGDDAKADAFAERMKEYEAQLGSMASKAQTARDVVSG